MPASWSQADIDEVGIQLKLPDSEAPSPDMQAFSHKPQPKPKFSLR